MNFRKPIEWLIDKIRINNPFYLVLSLFIASYAFIYYPSIHPKINISGQSNHFHIALDKYFKSCEIFFDHELYLKKYLMQQSSTNEFEKNRKNFGKDINQNLKSVKVNNLFLNGKLENDSETIRINFSYQDFSELKINKIKINKKEVDIRNFYKDQFYSKKKELVDKNKITKTISNFLIKFNNPASNLIITILIFYVFILLFELFQYLKFDLFTQSLEKKIAKKYKFLNNMEQVKEDFAEFYFKRSSKYKLSQLLGPSIGFLLTISSLIVGLNPNIREIQNISLFFDSIQVAMISTFIGLAIRIIAICLQKLNKKIFIKIDAIIINNYSNYDA